MQTLYALYLQNPFWAWLAVGAVFVALDIATGRGKLIGPGVAAAALAFVNLAGARLGLIAELGVFVVLSALSMVLTSGLHRRRPYASPDSDVVAQKKTLPTSEARDGAAQDSSGRLIGRIGRTTGEFINGVGRVWIDGTEWSAEIDKGDDALPPDAPVRVIRVTGGVRLQVRGLMS